MEVKSNFSLQEGIKLDENRLIDVKINFSGIQRENLHRIEETVEIFLHSVKEILKKETD